MSREWTDIDDIFPEAGQLRREIWAPFDNDPQKMVAWYRELTRESTDGITGSSPDAVDDVLDELYALRFAISAYFDHDLQKYFAHLQRLSQQLLRAGWKEAPPPE